MVCAAMQPPKQAMSVDFEDQRKILFHALGYYWNGWTGKPALSCQLYYQTPTLPQHNPVYSSWYIQNIFSEKTQLVMNRTELTQETIFWCLSARQKQSKEMKLLIFQCCCHCQHDNHLVKVFQIIWSWGNTRDPITYNFYFNENWDYSLGKNQMEMTLPTKQLTSWNQSWLNVGNNRNTRTDQGISSWGCNYVCT